MLEFEGMVHTMIGMPLSFVGAVTTSLKFIGILNRYVVDQTSNVQNEVVSKTMAATKEGMRGSVCPHCGKLVEEGSRFCDNCGKLLTYLCTS